jgi:hypothetical protein
MHTWNMLGDDFDRATDGKYKQKHDPEERYDFMDAEHKREIDLFFRKRDRALEWSRKEKATSLCRQLCKHLTSFPHCSNSFILLKVLA